MSAVDFSRLSAYWQQLAPAIGGGNITEVTDTTNGSADFGSADHSVHLRRDDSWWVVDVTNDRNQRRRVARFSNFALAEKYLIWDWATTANSDLASGVLGADLAKQGFSAQVSAPEAVDGGYQICSADGCAVLSIVNATIFSHLMLTPIEDIERIVRSKR